MRKAARDREGVASSETARAINRDVLLHAIHRHQPVSRADLARLTGLQPSTVSVITGQLIHEGWVVAGELGRLPRGRRPTFVKLNEKHVTLGIDLRPGRASLAVVDINGKILSREEIVYARHDDPQEEARQAILDVAGAARTLRASRRGSMFDGVGVSVSGRVGRVTHRALFSPNAPWAQINVFGELQRLLKGPIEMENAANASLLAERWFGEFGGASNMIAVSVSEGLGTGLLVDGRLLRGSGDMAGEFGHMSIEETGPVCGCGNVGCWETFASNRAGLRYFREFVPGTNLDTFQQLLQLALAGNTNALRAIDRMASYLARGLAMLVTGLAPEVILVVGECTVLWSRIQPIVESHLAAKSITGRIPRVAPALDGDAARLRGAAALVLHKALFHHTEFSLVDRRRVE